MWTPKRILLLVLGFVMFCLAYGVYAYFLGGVDGLPPLPAECEASKTPDIPPDYFRREPPQVDRKLRMAFGDECPELKRQIKLEMIARGIVLSAGDFKVEPDGRVRLWPFSVIIFGKDRGEPASAKDRGEPKFPEINTVQSDVAFLRFDQPIETINDMANHKVVGGELIGTPGGKGVFLRNNRRTPQRDDDLTLTTDGPVFYEESRQQIWTAVDVRIIDEQNRDKDVPTEIKATGMDVYLISDDEKPPEAKVAEKAAKARSDKAKDKSAININGVKEIVLRSDVDMRLFVDSRSGFMGSPKSTPPKAHEEVKGTLLGKAAGPPNSPAPPSNSAPGTKPAVAAPSKDLVHIETQGRFHYDLLTDQARFDISQKPSPRPNRVEVRRRTGLNGLDQLDCEHLVLHFQRKNGAAGSSAPMSEGGTELEIEHAHAWGNQVTLASDVEVLTAFGNDLVHDARTRQSVLKGSPEIVVLKDGSEIRAQMLEITGSDDGQQAHIKGPGRINMLDSATKERTLQARFRDELISTKEGVYDKLELYGDAAFEELEPGQQLQPDQIPLFKQRLQADRLKVWLCPPEPTAASSPAEGDSQRRRPHHIEAIGQVSAQAPDMNVHDTDRLVIWFKDVVSSAGELPATLPPASGGASGRQQANAGSGNSLIGPTGKSAAGAANQPATDPNMPPFVGPPEQKSHPPIDLTAHSVEAHVLRTGERNDLEKLWCEGAVHVHQDPEGPDDKGVEIRGATLQLLKFVEGSVLTVSGEPAEVQLDKLTIFGPEVNIDQKDNKAWVIGAGMMRMPSNADLQGANKDAPSAKKNPPAEKPTETELTVYWTRDMIFNGKFAVYHGNVQAEQEESRVTCETMQVQLDRFVSLKGDNDRKAPPAKVDKLVCDQTVRVEDRKRENGKLVHYQRLDSPQLDFKNEEGILFAPGPGVLYMLQLGSKDDSGPGAVQFPGSPTGPKPATPPAARSGAKPASSEPVEQELKLTRITFFARMFANNITRTAIFYENVEVVNLPTDDPDIIIDIDHLPERAMYLRCDQLQVYNRQQTGTQGTQEMEARGNASVQSQDFWGRADVIKYDESKELMIFEAREGRLATLVRQKAKGTPQEELKGQKIYYWRNTGDFKIERGTGARVIQ